MNYYVAFFTAVVIVSLSLFLYFCSPSVYDRFKKCCDNLSVHTSKFLLFFLPLIFTLLMFLLISGIRIFGPVELVHNLQLPFGKSLSLSLNSDNIDFIFIILLLIFHLIKDRIIKKAQLPSLMPFHAYETHEDDKSVIFSNLVISCVIYIAICIFIFEFRGALTWTVFLLGRFVWLDQFDDKQWKTLKHGLFIQRWLTLLYIIIFAFSMLITYLTPFFLPAPISAGITLGIILGVAATMLLVGIIKAHEKRKADKCPGPAAPEHIVGEEPGSN